MSLAAAFDAMQENVNADPLQVEEARQRREMFQYAFGGEPDAETSVPTGSLARGSQIEPINDVDLLWVYDPSGHADWGVPGNSAQAALEYTRDQVKRLLGSEEALIDLFGDAGRYMKWVRHTRLQHHAVKCFLDDPDDDGAFTVDVVPALRREPNGFLIPETSSDDWIATDPVYLIERVLERHRGYGDGQFVGLLRVLKCWAKDNGKVIKGLTAEVLALSHLADAERPLALARFFQAALEHIHEPILDPAGLCGEVQPGLDRDKAEALLQDAAELSARAVTAAQRGKDDEAQCIWRKIFGEVMPQPTGGCDGGSSNGTAAATAAAAAPLGGRRRVRTVEEG
jgi:hypothetical protein